LFLRILKCAYIYFY